MFQAVEYTFMREINLDKHPTDTDNTTKDIARLMSALMSSLMLGVEESGKFPVVRGFPTTENQEEDEKCITEYLKKILQKCIWHWDPDYKPEKGKDWNEENGRERKIIEIGIAKHSGGVFIQSPVLCCESEWRDGREENI